MECLVLALCAICRNNDSINNLCPKCQEENPDWVHRRECLSEDIDYTADHSGLGLKDIQKWNKQIHVTQNDLLVLKALVSIETPTLAALKKATKLPENKIKYIVRKYKKLFKRYKRRHKQHSV